MTMLKSQQYKQRIKLLQNETTPPKKWQRRSLLSLSSSGDLKWSESTTRRHRPSEHANGSGGLPGGYFASSIRSPRGDVELASLDDKQVLSPVRGVTRRLDYSTAAAVTNELAQRGSSRPMAEGESKKIYISLKTKQVIRKEIEVNLQTFPVTLSNLALLLHGSKAVLDAVLEEPLTHSPGAKENDSEFHLLHGLQAISLNEDCEMEATRKSKREAYKRALSSYITRGNNQWVNSWEECEDVLGEIFLWTSTEAQGSKSDRDAVAVAEHLEEGTTVEEREALTVITRTSTPSKMTHSAKQKFPATKTIPKKATPSPIKAAVHSMKSSIKDIAQKGLKAKDPSHLSLENFRKMIENKIGPSKWNRVFWRPHHLTPSITEEAAARIDQRIEELEKSRTSKVDQILAARQEAELQRQAAERASSLLRPLTEEEEAIVQKALYGIGPPNEILASQDADSVQRSSMQRLQPGQWLNDEIINYFLKNCLARRDEKLCAAQPGRKRSHFFNSYFVQTMFDEKNQNPALRGKYAYKNVKRWSKKVPGKDIFNLKYIVCPINLDNMHWTSAVIFMEEKKIQYYDSLGGTDRTKLEGLLQYVKDEWKVKKGDEMDASGWKLVGCTRDTPRQLNGYDCGVFTCMFSDFISQDCPLLFSQKHVNQCRERIALSIMKNCAIE
eukprot:CCRYP_003747-RA/>CCRYP_003747-RA protein AED:0.09 eAED:0.09 QI:0/0/0/1/1/1/2/0/668